MINRCISCITCHDMVPTGDDNFCDRCRIEDLHERILEAKELAFDKLCEDIEHIVTRASASTAAAQSALNEADIIRALMRAKRSVEEVAGGS